jgi:hypothetical protein
MAEDLTERHKQPAALEAAAPPPRSAKAATDTVHTARFRIVYAVLAVLLGAAVGTLVVLSGGPDSGGGQRWSTWEPAGSAAERSQGIARFVAIRYRLESGRQMVAVSAARPPTVVSSNQQVPVSWVAVANGPNQEDIDVTRADDTVAYGLCGLGESCAIREGTATVARGRLLRREALELALYTFKYVDGIDSVVAFLPPQPGKRPRYALFVQKGDDYVSDALHRPLTQTLARQQDLTPSTLRAQDSAFISRFVEPHVFQYSFNQAGDGSVYLALQPFAA